MDKKDKISLDTLVAHAKSTGYIFQGSEIYGGLANTWDYGPLGVEFKNNIKNAWWKAFIRRQDNNVGLDSSILMNPTVWEASGHLKTFNDPLMECRSCNTRHRADQLIEDFDKSVDVESMEDQDLYNFIIDHNVKCPVCGKLDYTEIKKFNLMLKTFQGVVENAANTIYLRPETAQGIFINFKNVQRTMRKKVPFGIGQIGKSFRNEITPGNFIFRTREFEQMEMQFFVAPGSDDEWYNYWKQYCMQFIKDLGVNEDNLRFRDHTEEELSFYSNGTVDIEYKFPFGWGEIWGIANRTDYDLTQHQNYSKVNMEYLDPFTNEKYIPYVIEPSVGVERLLLTFLADAYKEEVLENGDVRKVMTLHPALAPVKAAILPLHKKLDDEAREVFKMLSEDFNVQYDTSGAIGRRYRRQDEIGTPFCITFDFESLEDKMVTVRHRDSMEQERVLISDLTEYINKSIKF
ncbi:MAG: glycine--tRNA ligase [Erysipelothrix sp.]|nr:glycine--tRNA ligase [Erysipelothrix sp.]